MRTLAFALALVVATTSTGLAATPPRYAPDASDAAVAVALDSYPLDDVSREVPAKGKFTCPEVDLVTYGGTLVKLHKRVRMNAAFIERVRRFEQVLVDVATKIYGRAPTVVPMIRASRTRGSTCSTPSTR